MSDIYINSSAMVDSLNWVILGYREKQKSPVSDEPTAGQGVGEFTPENLRVFILVYICSIPSPFSYLQTEVSFCYNSFNRN